MATLTTQDEYIKTALRLPRELHTSVQEAAEKAGRSMNAEIIERLSSSFEPSKETELASLLLEALRTLGPLQVLADRFLSRTLVDEIDPKSNPRISVDLPTEDLEYYRKLAAYRGISLESLLLETMRDAVTEDIARIRKSNKDHVDKLTEAATSALSKVSTTEKKK